MQDTQTGRFDNEKAPRRSMLEPAFRKWESLLAGATKGSVKVDPMMLVPPIKASSLVVALREAIKGYETFTYHSELIPVAYEIRRIRIYEMKDGTVLIENKYEDRMKQLEKAENKKTMIVSGSGNIVWKGQKQTFEKTIKLDIHQVEQLKELFDGLEKRTVNGYEWAIIVKIDDESGLEKLKAMQKRFQSTTIEELNEGWWRVCGT